jgi:hypothetical protein
MGIEKKIKVMQVVSPESLRIIDVTRSTYQWCISILLRMIIFTLRGSGRKLKNVRVESPQSLVVIDLQARDKCQVISYSGRKQEEAE